MLGINSFRRRVVRHWNRLPKKAVDVSFLKGQVGEDCEQPGLVEGAPAHGR